MRAVKWVLSAIVAIVSLMSLGTGEARSQQLFVQICNNTNIHAWATLTAHEREGDPRFLIDGWYEIPARSCQDIKYVGRGWIYFYAESDDGRIWWSGNSQRFCVQYPGPFARYISDDFNCSGNLLKSFAGYYANGGTFTWEMD
jgi:uncharacterized membrane protein